MKLSQNTVSFMGKKIIYEKNGSILFNIEFGGTLSLSEYGNVDGGIVCIIYS